MALQNGVDLIIELPVLYSISSSENFAEGSIKILNSLGIIDFLSFGSETSDIKILNNFANILYDEPKEYKKNIIQLLRYWFIFFLRHVKMHCLNI